MNDHFQRIYFQKPVRAGIAIAISGKGAGTIDELPVLGIAMDAQAEHFLLRSAHQLDSDIITRFKQLLFLETQIYFDRPKFRSRYPFRP